MRLRALLLAASLALPAQALDAFEIQVYDGTANGPGEFALETHSNLGADPSQLHLTFEPSYGVTRSFELGAYLQLARLADGSLRYAGSKLRAKLVTAPGFDAHWRLALNFELSAVPQEFEPSRLGGEVRPIAAWESDRLLFAFNPIVGLAFGRPDAAAGPSFEPAAMAKVKLGPLAFGLEYYASLGTISGLPPLAEQRHYLFETVDLISVGALELSAGLGEGLTRASNALVAKLILGWAFGKRD